MAALAAPAAARGRRNWTIGEKNIRNWAMLEEEKDYWRLANMRQILHWEFDMKLRRNFEI